MFCVLFFAAFSDCALGEAPISLKCGEPIIRIMPPETKKETFIFEAQAGDKIVLSFPVIPNSVYSGLYGPDGKFIGGLYYSRLFTSGKRQTSLSLDVVNSGVYTVLVGRYDFSSAELQYALVWQRLNNPVNATMVEPGKIITGSMDTGKVDFYTFSAQAGDKILIILPIMAATFGPYIPTNLSYSEVYDEDGKKIGDFSSGKINFSAQKNGIYTLIVSGYGSRYALVWQKLNAPANATMIQPNSSISKSVGINEENNFHAFFHTFLAHAGDKVTVNFAGGHLYLEIYSPDGTKINGTTAGAIDFTAEKSGVYTMVITVSGFGFFWTIDYNLAFKIMSAAPTADSITPSSGVSQPDESVIFNTAYSDTDGYKNIQSVFLQFSDTPESSVKGFSVRYDEETELFYLRNDTDTDWGQGVNLGTLNKMLGNNYAKLDCEKSEALKRGGHTIIVKWHITFTKDFAGTHNIYMDVIDDVNISQGKVQKGTWTVTALAIDSFLPQDKSKFMANAQIKCSVGVSSADASYQYQFLVDGKVKGDFTKENAWNWQTVPEDIGAHTLTVRIKDGQGAQTEKSHRLIIYRKPVEP